KGNQHRMQGVAGKGHQSGRAYGQRFSEFLHDVPSIGVAVSPSFRGDYKRLHAGEQTGDPSTTEDIVRKTERPSGELRLMRHGWLKPGAASATCLLAGCTAGPLSALDPAGPAGADIAHISWVMIIGFGLVWLGVIVLAVYAFLTPRRESAPIRTLVIGGGLIFPSVVVLALLVYGIQSGKRMLPTATDESVFRVDVTGHQWWWEVTYPDAQEPLRLVNEMHIPAGQPVDIHIATADVIHS